MKRTFTVVCTSVVFAFVVFAGIQSGQAASVGTALQAQSSAGQSGSEQAGSSGQSGTYGQSSQSGASRHDSRSESREVTLTGCLSQGPNAGTYILMNASSSDRESSSPSGEASGMSSQAGSSSAGSQAGSMSGSEQTGTSGQSGTSMSDTAMTFELVGKSSELKKYVGQRVQVRGRVEPMAGSQMSSSAGTSGSDVSGQSGSSSGTSGQSGSSSGTSSSSGSMGGSSQSGSMSSEGGARHRVKVSSVKQLGSSCK